MRFINLLRQDVRIIPYEASKSELVIPSSGFAFLNERTSHEIVHDAVFGDVPVSVVTQEVVSMPDPQEDVSYIVSWKVLQAMRAQGYDVSDVYCPDTSVRADRGMIIGSRALVRYKQ